VGERGPVCGFGGGADRGGVLGVVGERAAGRQGGGGAGVVAADAGGDGAVAGEIGRASCRGRGGIEGLGEARGEGNVGGEAVGVAGRGRDASWPRGWSSGVCSAVLVGERGPVCGFGGGADRGGVLGVVGERAAGRQGGGGAGVVAADAGGDGAVAGAGEREGAGGQIGRASCREGGDRCWGAVAFIGVA